MVIAIHTVNKSSLRLVSSLVMRSCHSVQMLKYGSICLTLSVALQLGVIIVAERQRFIPWEWDYCMYGLLVAGTLIIILHAAFRKNNKMLIVLPIVYLFHVIIYLLGLRIVLVY